MLEWPADSWDFQMKVRISEVYRNINQLRDLTFFPIDVTFLPSLDGEQNTTQILGDLQCDGSELELLDCHPNLQQDCSQFAGLKCEGK